MYAEPGRPIKVVLTFVKGLRGCVFLSICWESLLHFYLQSRLQMSPGHYFGHDNSDNFFRRMFSVAENFFELAVIVV